MHHGIYDIRLVLFSVAIAMLTAYTTLDLAIKVTEAKLQSISIDYDWLTVIISVLPAILASGLAMYFCQGTRNYFSN